jgi:hypothetical protein
MPAGHGAALVREDAATAATCSGVSWMNVSRIQVSFSSATKRLDSPGARRQGIVRDPELRAFRDLADQTVVWDTITVRAKGA